MPTKTSAEFSMAASAVNKGLAVPSPSIHRVCDEPASVAQRTYGLTLHRVRPILNRQRTRISNAVHAHISEFGVVAPVGRLGVDRLLELVADASDDRVPEDARLCLQMLAAQLEVVVASGTVARATWRGA